MALQGSNMLKTLAEETPKYELCDDHPSEFKNMFCCDHNVMIRTFCVISHNNILVKSVDEVSKYVPSSDVDILYGATSSLEVLAYITQSSMHADLVRLDEQRQMMIRETHSVYDKLISKINKMFLDFQSATKSKFKIHILALNPRKKTIEGIVEKLK